MTQWEQAEKLSTELENELMNQVFDKEHRSTLFYTGIPADYALRCVGHSMMPTFLPGELVFIHKQETFVDGQICQVMIDGKHTLKRVYRMSNGFRLVPDNKLFKPVEITGKQAETVSIAGIAIARR